MPGIKRIHTHLWLSAAALCLGLFLTASTSTSDLASRTQNDTQQVTTRILHGMLNGDGTVFSAQPQGLLNATRHATGDYILAFRHPRSRDGRLPSPPTPLVSLLERSRSRCGQNNRRACFVIIKNVNEREVRYITLNRRRAHVDAASSFAVFWQE